MCGRFSLVHTTTELAGTFQISEMVPIAPRYNIAPTQPVAIVRDHPHRDGIRELAHVVWGLIPPWAEDTSMCGRMFNARSETAHEKPAFRNAFRRRRCIVPASGFFEWKSIQQAVEEESLSLFGENTTSGTKSAGTSRAIKQPYYISRVDGKLLPLAGLWEIWDGPNGETIESCTILTTTASRLMRPLYERMPIMMQESQVSQWLDRHNETPGALSCWPTIPDAELQAYPVSQIVNNARNDSPDCIKPAG